MSRVQNKTSMSTNRPEFELLLCCASVDKDSESAARIEALLQKELDWTYLLRLALPHAMMPLLYWHLRATSSEAVPDGILDQLQSYFHRNHRRNVVLTGQLLELLGGLRAREIPAVPYKGPTLAALAYGNLALREFGDLDILVHRQDVPRANELLISMEYQPEYVLTPSQEAVFLQYGHQHSFWRDDDIESVVELHWRIMERYYSFPLDSDYLWSRLERVSLNGKDVLTVSPEDLLLILCVHGCKHLWLRLAWICDVARLICVRKEMDWEQIMEQAARLGSERMLFLGLYLASDLLGAELPEEVSERVQADPTVEALAGQVYEQLSLWANASPEGFEIGPFHLFHLRARERLRDKIRYCVRLATTVNVRDWMFLPLPRYLYPLYHVIRPFRLTRKYVTTLLKRLL